MKGVLYGKDFIRIYSFVHFCTTAALAQCQGVCPLAPQSYLLIFKLSKAKKKLDKLTVDK